MKKKVLSILLVSILSLSLFVGCGNNNDNTNTQNPNQQEEQQMQEQQPEDNENDEETSVESDDKDTESDVVIAEVTDEQIESKFTEVMEYLYNRDYSNEENSLEAENYIKEHFTPEGSKDMINKIISYGDKVSYSDLLITLVKNVENNDDRYKSMYEIRYNISIAIGKPSIYSDVIAKVVVDENNKILIESINDFQF